MIESLKETLQNIIIYIIYILIYKNLLYKVFKTR